MHKCANEGITSAVSPDFRSAFFSRPTNICKQIRIVSLFATGFPSFEEARSLVDESIGESRRVGMRVIKLIHGYDKNSAGGKLRLAIRGHLWKREKGNEIRGMIPGERWAFWDEQSRKLLQYVPETIVDHDFCRKNKSITLIIL